MILLLGAYVPSVAQVRYTISPKNAEAVLKMENIRNTVEYLSNPALGGRASGTDGGRKTAAWLEGQFRDLYLQPLGGAWMHGFQMGGAFGRNVLGVIPGSASPGRYVIVMAHFDNLGTLGGTFYPGADSNASGVAALLEVARMFQHMQSRKRTYARGIIFAALDGKEKDLAGSRELWRLIDQGKLLDPVSGTPIGKDQIMLVVNLDQLGATLAPLTKGNPNYLMMLSDIAPGWRSTLENANRDQHIGLEIGYTYYGSADFTRLFYTRISDQRVFLEHGIPAVMFTSGITFRNNKPEDNAASLDYDILTARTRLIFFWLDKVL